MPSAPAPDGDRFVLRLGNYQLKLGPRTFVAAGLVVVLFVAGLLVSPGNLTAGIATGISGLVGAILGVLIDFQPVPVSHQAEAVGAVRKLRATAQAVEDVQTTLQGVAEATKNVRVDVGIANAQGDLERVRVDLYEAMGEWEQVSPGAAEAVQRMRSAGSDMLRQMTEEQEEG